MPWDPDRYHQFQRERSAPFEDLLALITVRKGLRVIDLGCGTGELTCRLAEALPGSDVLGIDSSPDMLARAHNRERPGVRFEMARIEDVQGTWDLVFSHAALQWVEGHQLLIPRLLGLVAPAGELAVQMPSNHGHLTQRLILEIAGEEPYCQALRGWTRRPPVLGVDAYAEMLYACGVSAMTVYEKVYAHVLEDAGALADWVAGTALVPYFERLPGELREPFMAEYRARVQARFPDRPAFLPFRRILFRAKK